VSDGLQGVLLGAVVFVVIVGTVMHPSSSSISMSISSRRDVWGARATKETEGAPNLEIGVEQGVEPKLVGWILKGVLDFVFVTANLTFFGAGVELLLLLLLLSLEMLNPTFLDGLADGLRDEPRGPGVLFFLRLLMSPRARRLADFGVLPILPGVKAANCFCWRGVCLLPKGVWDDLRGVFELAFKGVFIIILDDIEFEWIPTVEFSSENTFVSII